MVSNSSFSISAFHLNLVLNILRGVSVRWCQPGFVLNGILKQPDGEFSTHIKVSSLKRSSTETASKIFNRTTRPF